MSISIEEKNILDEMRKIRFMTKGIPEIERFEVLTEQIKKKNNIFCIPELCNIMEDSVSESSAIEKVIETILLIIKSKEENTVAGINKVIDSTSEMMNHAEDWAIILHTQFLFDNTLKDIYIKCVKESEYKGNVLEIMEILRTENSIKSLDFDDIITKMQ